MTHKRITFTLTILSGLLMLISHNSKIPNLTFTIVFGVLFILGLSILLSLKKQND